MKRSKEQPIRLNKPQESISLSNKYVLYTINVNRVRYYISQRYDGEYLDVDTGGML